MRDAERQDRTTMPERQKSAGETKTGTGVSSGMPSGTSSGAPAAAGAAASPARRRALARLGLGTAAAYMAPSLLRIDRSAQAQLFPTPCPPPGGPPSSRPAHCPPGGGPPGGGPPGS